MDDMLQNNAEHSSGVLPGKDALLCKALALGKLLDEHHGAEVMVMDMRDLNFWTDFFVIATVTSSTHLMGLERHIKDFARGEDLEILRRSKRTANNTMERSSDEWHILDLGEIVVHLMAATARSFFELERLWGAAPLIYQGGGRRNGLPLSHSSNSS